jgi:hypothetical protein
VVKVAEKYELKEILTKEKQKTRMKLAIMSGR